ncbi:MAG TPA: DUF3592 domain-containing protein [Thermoanaerobaculia bacterium]|nr:DUF3592 domain-containing protein [Thermoanaerobaculia bacterium]
MDKFTVWGLICIAVGCGFLGSALRIYVLRKQFLAGSETATGTVVEVRSRSGIGRNAVSVPVFEFRTAGGALHRAESLMGSGFRGFEIGEILPIRYDPRDPSRAEVDSYAVLWGLAQLRTGYGVFFLLMGAVGIAFLGK